MGGRDARPPQRNPGHEGTEIRDGLRQVTRRTAHRDPE